MRFRTFREFKFPGNSSGYDIFVQFHTLFGGIGSRPFNYYTMCIFRRGKIIITCQVRKRLQRRNYKLVNHFGSDPHP